MTLVSYPNKRPPSAATAAISLRYTVRPQSIGLQRVHNGSTAAGHAKWNQNPAPCRAAKNLRRREAKAPAAAMVMKPLVGWPPVVIVIHRSPGSLGPNRSDRKCV
jgi:hypothetical protein